MRIAEISRKNRPLNLPLAGFHAAKRTGSTWMDMLVGDGD